MKPSEKELQLIAFSIKRFEDKTGCNFYLVVIYSVRYLGYEKYKTPVTEEIIRAVYEKAAVIY